MNRAIAAENVDPKGLPAEDLAALDTPAVRQAFHAAAERVARPCLIQAPPGGRVSCGG